MPPRIPIPPPRPMLRQKPPTKREVVLLSSVAAAAFCALVLAILLPFLGKGKLKMAEKETYDRDALAPGTPINPFPQIFSENNEKSYEEGSGFEIHFLTRNDPSNGYATTDRKVVLEPAADKNFYRPKRKKEIEAARQELRQGIADFNTPLPVPRSLEIGVDVTDGMNKDLKDFILSKLDDFQDRVLSPKDPTTVLLFRISDSDFRDYHPRWVVQPTQPVKDSRDQLRQSLTDWALQDQGPTHRTSLSTGLFNMLEIDKDLRQRDIYIFSDGMENYPGMTDDFYNAAKKGLDLLNKDTQAEMDSKLSKLEHFPDLRFARVHWYFVHHDWPFYRNVQRYWEHVLRDRCHAEQVEIIY